MRLTHDPVKRIAYRRLGASVPRLGVNTPSMLNPEPRPLKRWCLAPELLPSFDISVLNPEPRPLKRFIFNDAYVDDLHHFSAQP